MQVEVFEVPTFFICGSLIGSVRLLRALRIWEAATLVEVFSKACWVRVRLVLGILKTMDDDSKESADK
jgi:hypothetical protein